MTSADGGRRHTTFQSFKIRPFFNQRACMTGCCIHRCLADDVTVLRWYGGIDPRSYSTFGIKLSSRLGWNDINGASNSNITDNVCVLTLLTHELHVLFLLLHYVFEFGLPIVQLCIPPLHRHCFPPVHTTPPPTPLPKRNLQKPG